MELRQEVSLRFIVDLEVMPMKMYSTIPQIFKIGASSDLG